MPKVPRRTVLLLLVAVLIAMPWAASAAGPQSPRPARALQAGELDLFSFSRIWSFLTRKNGCGIDPDGLCAPKNGCEVDPNGHCLPHGSSLVTGDNGCGLDPSGHCREGQSPVQTKNGCELDPNGRCLR